MKVEPTVLVVSGGDTPSDLLAALEEQGVFVERAGPTSFAEVLPVVAPDLVLAWGDSLALPILQTLRATDRTLRARLAVVADRSAQSALRELDREILVTVLSNDVPVQALAMRLSTVAKRLAERASAARASSRPPPVVTTTIASNVRSLSSMLKLPGDRSGADPKKGLASLNASVARRGTLSSDKLKAMPQPDLSLPQRADASKWRRSGRAHRVVLADDDVTRGAAVAQALIARGLEVQVVPLDPARTRWSQLQQHCPEVLIVDEAGTTDHRKVWLELFAADRVLQSARVIKVNLRSLFNETTLTVSLKALEKHIEGLAAWRHEMPTIIDDEERPTLVGGSEGSGPHVMHPATEFEADFDDRPTMARAPSAEQAPAPSPARSYGPPSVQLTDSIIAESKKFFAPGPTVPAPAPLPVQSSHPPRPVTSPPAPTSWKPVSSSPLRAPEPAALAPVFPAGPSQPARSLPASGVPPASTFGQMTSSTVSSRPPASWRPPSRLSTEPYTQPRKSSALVWAGLGLLLIAAAGAWLILSGRLTSSPGTAVDGARASNSKADGSTASDGPAGDTVLGKKAGPGKAADALPAAASSLWTLGPGDALPCEKVVDPPAEVTALSLEAGSRAWEKARGLLVLGDMLGAQRQMCTAVLNHPQSLALEGLAALYLTLRTPTEALRWVEQALGVRPERAKTLELYGDVLVMLGREADARKAWLSGLKMPAENAKTIQLLAKNLTEEGDKALRSGDVPRAEQLARRAAGLDMDSSRAAGTMAAVLLAAGQVELAERWTARCVGLDPEEPSCLLAQGDLALSKGDIKAARARYEKVTRLAPGDRRAWQKLGGAAPRQDGPAAEPDLEEPVIEEPVAEEPAPAEPE